MKSKNFKSMEILVSRWKDGTFKELLDDWKWIFSYSRKYKKTILFFTVFGVLSTSLGVASSIASKYVIDIITGYKMEQLGILAAVMVGGTVFNLVFKNLLNRISARLTLDIHNDIQADIFDKIMDADWLSLSQYASGDVLNRFHNDIHAVSSNAVRWLPNVVIAGYHFVVTFAVIFYYDKMMALLSLITAPLMFLSSRYVLAKQREYGTQVREMSSNLMAFEAEAFHNYDTLKSFGVTSLYSRKMRRWQKRFKEISLKYNLFSIKTSIWMSLLGALAQYAAFGYSLYLLWTKVITFGTMTLFLQQGRTLMDAFQGIVTIVPSFVSSSVSAHRIRELAELPKESKHIMHDDLECVTEEGLEVHLKDIGFSYEEGSEVISNSEFMARPGEIVALVGASGEGKTTMIRLILGLVRPKEGKVVLIDANGKEVHVDAQTRTMFAYVPQGNTILSGTIADNLRMVKEDATDDELREVLKIACAWEFVEKLPEQMYTKIGEKGHGLSEGQAQRVAIARAILRDAPILLLDEATSALDMDTERQVLHNIIKQKPNKTCIITTHRPSALGMCQRVYRVIQTKVTELGDKELK